MSFVKILESELGCKAEIEKLPLQPGDVPDTFADVDDLYRDLQYKPSTSTKCGIKQFVQWYIEYFKL